LSDKKLALVALADLGLAVANIFNNKSLIGKDIYIASDHLKGTEIAAEFSN
jgi:hypothetical protein